MFQKVWDAVLYTVLCILCSICKALDVVEKAYKADPAEFVGGIFCVFVLPTVGYAGFWLACYLKYR